MEEIEQKEVKEQEDVSKNTEVADTFEKEIEVPSNGALGGPKKITIRAMTTAEEKILYSVRDESYIKRICKACTVSPKSLDMSKITPNDLMFILFQIRELTFGSIYKQPVRCPFCGKVQEVDINIADFDYTLLDEDKSELFIDLPITKANVHLKLLSQQEIDNIDNEAAKLYRDGKISDPDGHSMVKKVTAMIDTVTGVDFQNDNDKFAWVNKLHLADFNTITNAIGKIKYGINNTTTVKCEFCDEEVEVNGTVCPEFFRPTV